VQPLTPLWIATAPGTTYERLESPRTVDVAVLGGGIAGLTTALFLRERGASVVLLEADRIGLGATARATVKVTAGHGLRYGEIAARQGMDAAAAYAELNQIALRTIEELIDRYRIDCAWASRRHIVCADSEEDAARVRDEAALQGQLGLPVSFADHCDLPFPTSGCIVMENQAQFHPRRYMLGLAEALIRAGGEIFEGSRAYDIAEGSPCTVEVNDTTLSARDVVIATGAPISDRGLLLTRMVPLQEYAVAAEISEEAAPADMYLSANEGDWSLRTARIEAHTYLIAVGGKHAVGRPPEGDPYEAMFEWLKERFPVGELKSQWSTRDFWPVDGLPYAGRLGHGSDHVWVATGFGGWGMTNGTAAASIVADLIDGREGRDAAALLAPQRGDVTAAPATFVRQNAEVAAHWIGDRFRGLSTDLADLAPDDAAVVRAGGRLVAVYRDEKNDVHAVSAVCTHLRCVVNWNGADRTWDCPCHGSRFDIEGNVVASPATRPLDRVHLDA
jgi:glycine/D-amino acid oxidase-like deaminating enzyme/nitrite reductase/ring-hydroxylating ferredoxin subunit